MKNKINFLLILLTIAITAIGCDNIEEPYRQGGSPAPLDTTVVYRKVFIEEFTGFRCNNCPAAADVAKSIHELYPDNVVLLSIHSGDMATPLASPSPFTYNFITTEGDKLYSDFDVQFTPAGLINRTIYQGYYTIEKENWQDLVISMLKDTAIMKITFSKAEYNSSTGKIDVEVKIKYIKEGTANHYVAAYIAENGIINMQKDKRKTPEEIEDYEHNHVLRKSFTGTYGTQLSTAPIPAGTEFTQNFTYTLPTGSDWRPANLRIIVFVNDYNVSKNILQVEESSLTIK